ncbi:protein kinase domain-containing protein [Neobacillus rhizophilus]|uniref:Protein kinase n=1 Tax=Neobacillus rhizophilus TaxID=2833579 RepID=A0A942YTT0_9BACI|nr:protein kinase [Neobacillus rhizophilus]MBS4213238.1 protein kinase [Neobacillus rhizophilus]
MSELDNFLQIKHNQFSSKYNSEKIDLYKEYYTGFGNAHLTEIFSILHSNLNDLFSFMNSKNGVYGGHFNAAESRELLDIIEQIRILQAKLKSEYSFEIDQYYMEIINSCRSFLKQSGGSSIPEEFPIIDIIEERPMFIKANITEIQSPENTSKITLHQIGGGSYAKVFKYSDPHYGTEFAVKRAKDDLREDELVRFKNEFNDLKNLDSPFIIKAYTYSDEKNEYTMELADQTLEKFMRYNNNSLSFASRRAFIIQLLNAFEYIHQKGLLHRDISYQNILIKKFEDGTNFIKVSDFGLVKRPESSLTRQGTETKGAINDYSDLDIVGFENYEIRHETFVLAKVIYYILTGRESNYHKEESEQLRKFILKAIGDKENRFNNVAEMKKVLLTEIFPSVRNQQEQV